MTSADRNDPVPAKSKLEWVTPKISLMGAEETSGNKNTAACAEGIKEVVIGVCVADDSFGPS
jgi:hypothetical protein